MIWISHATQYRTIRMYSESAAGTECGRETLDYRVFHECHASVTTTEEKA